MHEHVFVLSTEHLQNYGTGSWWDEETRVTGVATGLYAYEELPHQYEHRGPGLLLDAPEPMVTDFTRDIVDGIAGTGVKAAFLKCCVEAAGLTHGVDRIAHVFTARLPAVRCSCTDAILPGGQRVTKPAPHPVLNSGGNRTPGRIDG